MTNIVNPWISMLESSQRRIDSDTQFNLFWVTDLNGNYGFCLQTSEMFRKVDDVIKLKGISILKRNSKKNYGELFLILNKKEDWEIFHTLCEDLITITHVYSTEDKMIYAVETRLKRWQQLLKQDRNEKLTIERIDVNKGYSPDNCKWATRKEQSNNTRVTKIITYNGQSKPLHQWAEELCINPDTLYARVFRNGWSVEKAFTTPAREMNSTGIEFNGETNSITEWARIIGISKSLLWARINRLGWSIERSLTYGR